MREYFPNSFYEASTFTIINQTKTLQKEKNTTA